MVNGIHHGPGGFWGGDLQACTAHLYDHEPYYPGRDCPWKCNPGDPKCLCTANEAAGLTDRESASE